MLAFEREVYSTPKMVVTLFDEDIITDSPLGEDEMELDFG